MVEVKLRLGLRLGMLTSSDRSASAFFSPRRASEIIQQHIPIASKQILWSHITVEYIEQVSHAQSGDDTIGA